MLCKDIYAIHIGVYSRIGPAASLYIVFVAYYIFERGLKHLLYAYRVTLYLPAVIISSVVGQGQKYISHLTVAGKNMLHIITPQSTNRQAASP